MIRNDQMSDAFLRLFALFGIATAIFLASSDLVVVLLAIGALVLCLTNSVSRQPVLKALYKLRYLALLVVLSYAGTLGSEPVSPWNINLGLGGFYLSFIPDGISAGAMVVSKIGTMVALSAWLIASTSAAAVSEALSFVLRAGWLGAVVSRCLGLLVSRGEQKGRRGAGKARKHAHTNQVVIHPSKNTSIAGLRQRIQSQIERWLLEAHAKFSGGHGRDDEIGLIGLCCVAILSTKALMIFPGLPISPGHKNIFIIPIFIFAAAASARYWTATKVGLAAGILNFLMGFGKYGPLEVFQFLLPGLAIDLLYPLILLAARKPRLGPLIFILVGIVAGVCRFSGNALALLLTGTPLLLLLSMIPALLSQMLFASVGSVLSGAWIVELASRFQSDLAQDDFASEEAREYSHAED